jgi:hypothetical protein
MKTVRTPKRWLVKLSRIAFAVAVVLSPRVLMSQGGLPSFGQSPMASGPSGAASEVVNSNRNGFGMSFRGGHVAGDTVGRSDSITHIGLMPHINIEDGLFFGDSRLLRGNDGGLAWSFGGGYRHYIADWDTVIGGNSYFDRDQLTGAHLKQWGLGAELLSHRWEARGNYYQTFGETSSQTGSRVDQGSVAFAGNNLVFTRIDSFAEGLKGWDSELGFLLPGEISERFDIRAFGGGYFYEGENIDGFGGWQTRLQADIAKWLELGVKLTNDEVFDTTVSFSVAMHFGGFTSQEHTKRSAIQRFADPVRRNMNIVATTSDVAAPGQIATNPLDNTPFTVAHVNSNDTTGPFNGTLENPFSSLSQGLGSGSDIVFVHAGSQFNSPPNNTVSLAAGQQLLGEGLIQAVTGDRLVVNRVNLGGIGDIILPSSPTFIASDFTLARPTLLNSPGNAVTLSDDTQFSGFIIDSPGQNGIFSNAADRTIINDVLITDAGASGIRLLNTSDTTTIRNTIIDGAAGPAFFVSGGTGRIGYGSTSTNEDPSFSAIINSSQEAVLIENMTAGFVNMTGATINDNGGAGVLIRNNAGNATIDNATIVNSTGNGIAILSSSGTYTFRDTIRAATTVDNAAAESVLIDGLTPTGRVSFDNLSIQNRRDTGIEVSNNAGQAIFGTLTTSTTIGPPAAGAAPAIDVRNSAATGVVRFAGSLAVNGSNGRGINLTNNAEGSIFDVASPTVLTNISGESVAIVSDNSQVFFRNGLTINQRNDTGILIQNFDGSAGFLGSTNVNNQNLVQESGVIISASEATVTFEQLNVFNSTLNPGVFLANNIAGANGSALISFSSLTINSIAGEGLFGIDNTNVRVSNGTIVSQGAAAVNLEETGINMSFESISSSGSPGFGIRLVETNKPAGFNQFNVTAATNRLVPGNGGTIQTAGVAGVLMQNAGQVHLQAMILDDNENAIIVENSGLDDEDDQLLELYSSRVSRSDVRGIYALNLIGLDIRDTTFDDNGDDGALGRETILSEYNERLNLDTTEEFLDFDNPYLVIMQRNTIIDNSTDAVVIGSLAGATGAHLGLNFDRNNFTLTNTTDPTTPLVGPFAVNTFDSNRTRDDAIVVRWNGPTRQIFTTNTITLSGVGPQTGFDVIALSATDVYELNLEGNQIDSTVTGQITGQQIGLLMRTFGPSSSVIRANDFRFTGGEGRGMEFSLGANTDMALTNNTIIDNTDGGAGMIFTTVSQPSNFGFNGNTIGLFDTGTGIEEGIRFISVAGTVNLFGNQNNQIVLGNPNAPGAFIESIFTMPAGTNNGQIIVNGVLVP